MSYDSVDEGAEIRACESCAEITRGWNQHGGGSRDPVAHFRFVAASSVSISRRGPIGWTAIGAGRGLHHDHTQDACESGPRPACTCDAFRNDNQRDRATCYLRLSVGNPRAWLGAHLGLTPRQYQSGEVDRSGRISKCGDTLARTLLYEAAVVILTRLKKASSLKDWGHAIARRSGNGKARVAVARKLSVILHSVWRSGQPFGWPEHANAA